MSTVGEKMDYSIPMTKANIYSVVFIIPILALIALYVLIWGADGIKFSLGQLKSSLSFVFAAVIILGGIIVHEGIHGLAWMLFSGKPKETIKFGFNWKALSPYAHCTEPMAIIPYRLGCMMPAIIVGILPYLAGLLSGNASLFLFGIFFTFAASGDFLILWSIRDVKKGQLVEDHPTNAGCYVYDQS